MEANDAALIEISRNALTIVRYAVASLPPESNRGWPFNELRALASLLPALPPSGDSAPEDLKSLATTFEVFALECERYDLRRRELKIDPQTLMPITR